MLKQRATKKNELGGLRCISLNLSEPIKIEVTDMEFNQLCILVGTNGSGKTFIMKSVWYLTTVIHSKIASMEIGMNDFPLGEYAQFVLDNTFVDHGMNGVMKAHYKCGSYVEVSVDNGKVQFVDIHIAEGVTHSAQPVFMSKDTRLCDDIVKYLRMKKALGLPKGMPSNYTAMTRLLDCYRLYDVVYIEQLLSKIEKDTTEAVMSRFSSVLSGFDEDNFEVKGVKVDYDKPDLLYSADGETYKSTGKLGAGHQAIFTMFLFQSY